MKLRHEIKFILLTVFLLVAVSNGYPESSQSEVVWHWTDEAHAEKYIIFETTVDGTVVSTAKFPVRRDARSEIIPEKKQRIIEYNFTLHKKRGRNFRGITHGKVEGNIWEAGGEKNGIIFGITWDTQDKIILHELYPVLEDKAENIEIYKGVYFKTYWTSK